MDSFTEISDTVQNLVDSNAAEIITWQPNISYKLIEQGKSSIVLCSSLRHADRWRNIILADIRKWHISYKMNSPFVFTLLDKITIEILPNPTIQQLLGRKDILIIDVRNLYIYQGK